MLRYAQGRFISYRKYVVATTDTLVVGDKVATDRIELIQQLLAFLGYQVQLTGQVLS